MSLVPPFQLIKTNFPCHLRPHDITITDRPWHERKKLREELGWYPFPCRKHFERDTKEFVGPAVWNGGGQKCFMDFTTAVGELAFTKAHAAMKRRYPSMLAYMEESEAAQDVYSTLDLLRHPYLKWSFSDYALTEHCKRYGVTLFHNKLGAPTVCTNNMVESQNAVDERLQTRYKPPLAFFEEKLALYSARLQTVMTALSSHPHTLIPNVNAVFVHAMRDISSFSVRSVGLGGGMVLNHMVRSRDDGRLHTHINTLTRTCDHPGCLRVVQTHESCSHLLRGDQHLKLFSEPAAYLEKHYPPYFQTQPTLRLLRELNAYCAPNLSDMNCEDVRPLRRAPPATVSRSDGRPKNNVIRHPHPAELHK